jgi:lipoyl(octanoyl) transferase
MAMGDALEAVWLGRVDYAVGVRVQEALRARILDGDPCAERLLFVEHPPTITLGRSARLEHLLRSRTQLEALGVTVSESSRGGDVTFHGPGQLVAYPVLKLARGVVAHIEALGAGAVSAARACGVSAELRRAPVGVFCGPRKLAAIGIHVHRRVAMHGLALNVSTTLDAFSLIVPCGLSDVEVTSLEAERPGPVALEHLLEPFAAGFAALAGRRVRVGASLPADLEVKEA